MSQTSSSSSKLLHGGLRYLENFEFRLVKKALKERQWWLQKVPQYTHPIKLYIPVYKNNKRPAWLYKTGLWLYNLLAGKENIGKYQIYSKSEMLQQCPELKTQGLQKGLSFFDGQMDDYKLGLWAIEQAKKESCLTVQEHTTVLSITTQGKINYQAQQNKYTKQYDKIINTAGPWAQQLLQQSGILAEYKLDLVRGSHIVIKQPIQHGFFLEMPGENRIFFVLPYQGQTLIGTTEHRQKLSDPIKISQQETDCLIKAYNHYFKQEIDEQDISYSFSGLRPLIKSKNDVEKTSREYAIQVNNKLISVFGGKWTTSRQLAKKVVKVVG